MKFINKEIQHPFWCHYCGRADVDLVQLGDSAEEWPEGASVVSPEDANAVEICKDCVEKAIAFLECKTISGGDRIRTPLGCEG